MPKIHFPGEGERQDGSRITDILDISASQLAALPDCSSEFSSLPPVVNPEVAAHFYVVIEILEGEETDCYPYEGFYLLEEISPTELMAALRQYKECYSFDSARWTRSESIRDALPATGTAIDS